ncbi:MAG: hypothetical protein IPK54_10260 [Dokdonella sp.]|uniref:hypothetical protein n=1 Tax=Dokdonella sp. TaxID=2291710 RepID=UPI0025BA7BB7|nr:hypothetical protein [Dokdonella sp.]MBK8123915.1 hypothetical protein [Dokdonella sp.]
MSWNPYKRLVALTAGPPTDVGEVLDGDGDGVIVGLVSGALIRARGTATLGDWVYVRGGVVEGPAPNLPGTEIEV